MKYNRFYDNYVSKSKEVTITDFVLVLAVLWGMSFVIIPLIILFVMFLSSVVLYTIIECAYRSLQRLYK
jgi:multisubunit Na+/H+ antiporter MnhG subunit